MSLHLTKFPLADLVDVGMNTLGEVDGYAGERVDLLFDELHSVKVEVAVGKRELAARRKQDHCWTCNGFLCRVLASLTLKRFF